MAPLDETIRGGDGEAAADEAAPPPHLSVVLECARALAGAASLRVDGVGEIAFGRAAIRGANIEAIIHRWMRRFGLDPNAYRK